MKAGVKIAFWTDPGWAVALRDGVPMRGPDGESLLTYRVQLTTSETALAQEQVVSTLSSVDVVFSVARIDDAGQPTEVWRRAPVVP